MPVVNRKGSPVAWIPRSSSGVTVGAFKQPDLQLRLHSGTADAGTLGWRYGPAIAGPKLRRLVAAFNGGFRLNVGAGAGGFESYGRVAAPLSNGLGSVVTYTDGTTDIGSWRQEVPAPCARLSWTSTRSGWPATSTAIVAAPRPWPRSRSSRARTAFRGNTSHLGVAVFVSL